MIGGDQFRAAEVEPLAAESARCPEWCASSVCAAHAPRQQITFGWIAASWRRKIWRAGGDFVLFRQAIFGRAAFDDVADVNVFAAQAHRFDHLREKFSGAAYERLALHVFVVAGAFADEHELRFRIAHAEDDIVARLVQFAARALAEIGADVVRACRQGRDRDLRKAKGRWRRGMMPARRWRSGSVRRAWRRRGSRRFRGLRFRGGHSHRLNRHISMRRGSNLPGAVSKIRTEAEIVTVAEPCFRTATLRRIHRFPSLCCLKRFSPGEV